MRKNNITETSSKRQVGDGTIPGLSRWFLFAPKPAQAVEQAMGMVERFQRIFTRTLKALCDLRRRPLAVVVQGAGQVNIGEQQVNVAGQDAAKAIRRAGDGERAPRAIELLPEP